MFSYAPSVPLTVNTGNQVLPCDPDSMICSVIGSGNSQIEARRGCMGYVFSRALMPSPWLRGQPSREHVPLLKEERGESLQLCHLFSPSLLASGLFAVLLLLWDL